jgi:ribonuclease-3
MNTRLAAVEALEARIGHAFADRDLLERALTHASVGQGATAVGHNERLEFLGDRVLNLTVAEHIMAARPDYTEGELSKLMSRLVDYKTCAAAARAAGLPDALRFDASASKMGARKNDRVLGDACEALIAALYLDGGLETARTFVTTFWAEPLKDLGRPEKDPKTLLQEWAMARALPLPAYAMLDQTGPSHEPRFTIEVRIQGFAPEAAEAGSKRDAEKAAAQRMLDARLPEGHRPDDPGKEDPQ